jgi:hypothetical protein
VSDQDRLRDYHSIHIDEHIPVLSGYYDNVLFYNCTIDAVKNAHLHNCVLTGSTFPGQSLADFQGLTLTLDCHSFYNVELSEAALDYILMLLVKTRGNNEKREKIIEAIGGKAKVIALLKQTRR